MYAIYDTMHCKPGKVREMIDRFKRLNALAPRMGMPTSRILTDVSGDPFWSITVITEVEHLDDFFGSMEKAFANEEARTLMAGYHDLVVSGERKIYKVEA